MNSATYSPEDNKLRLYVGRVPRDEYEKLRANGWTSTPKQDCDFVATWTPSRRDTCLEYADTIEDEDKNPEDRAADRAERFGGYLDKRLTEATGHADRYESGPSAHGYQSEKRAERAAARHDRIGSSACDAWSKAEYWQRRTSSVISHALHVSSPGVRMGRIKEIEADIRKAEKSREEYASKYAFVASLRDNPEKLEAMISKISSGYSYDREKALDSIASTILGNGKYHHPRNPERLEYVSWLMASALIVGESKGQPNPDPLTIEDVFAMYFARSRNPELPEFKESRLMQWINHYKLRIAYENQMLEAQGGRAAFVEMEVGGWIAGRQIQKVNKSPATGRVVSVLVRDNQPSFKNHYGNPYPDGIARVLSHQIKTERLPESAYRPPTDEERAAFLGAKKAAKAAAPKVMTIPLINPTDDDAQRLQDALNERAKADHCARHLKAYGLDYASEFKPSTVCRITQANYSAASKGSYARAETRGICRNAEIEPRASNMYSSRAIAEEARRGPKACEVRTTSSDGSDYGARRVIILTDKPQKPLPAAAWLPLLPEPEKVEALQGRDSRGLSYSVNL